MSTSPAEMSAEGGGGALGGRSRNAQAQADLRARRKTYICDLEIKNGNLCQDNEKLKREKKYFQEQVGLLKGQIKTLKESLGMRKTATSSTVDSLLAAVEAERSKVKRLRGAIREMALMEAQDSDSEQEHSSRKRTRTLSSSSSSYSLHDTLTVSKEAAPDLKVDNESVATLTTSSLSPPTPTLVNPMSSLVCGQWIDAKSQQQPPPQCIEEEQDTSRSALTLLLAQSSSFKRQVVNVLAHDLQSPNHIADWSQWQAPPASKADKGSHQLGSETKVHDEILERFLSSISSPSEPIRTRTSHDQRGHYCSASIFLVLSSYC